MECNILEVNCDEIPYINDDEKQFYNLLDSIMHQDPDGSVFKKDGSRHT